MFSTILKMVTGQEPQVTFVPPKPAATLIVQPNLYDYNARRPAQVLADAEPDAQADKVKFLPKTEALLDCVEMKPLPDRIQFGSVLVSADPRRRTPLLVVGVSGNFIEVQEWANDMGRVRQVMEGTFRRTTKNHGYRLLLTAAEVGEQNFLREHGV